MLKTNRNEIIYYYFIKLQDKCRISKEKNHLFKDWFYSFINFINIKKIVKKS